MRQDRENIEKMRKKRNLTEEGIGRMLGVTSRTYRNYIAGGPIPSDKLITMAELFGCTTDYLLGRGNAFR